MATKENEKVKESEENPIGNGMERIEEAVFNWGQNDQNKKSEEIAIFQALKTFC